MSQIESPQVRLERFLKDYCGEELTALAEGYPRDKQSLYVDFADLYQFDQDIAADFETDHETVLEWLQTALENVELGVEVDVSDAKVRLTDTQAYLERLSVSEVKDSDYIGEYVALRAQIGDVTGKMSRMVETAFECQRCGTMTYIPQPFTKFQEPHECQGCDRQGPFQINYSETEFVNQRKVRLEEPPEQQAKSTGEDIVGYCLNDLVDIGGENGLADQAGSRVTVLGTVEIDDSELMGRGKSEPVIDKFFKPEAFIFDEETETIDVEQYREEVEAYASKEDAIDLFRQSIDPGLTIVGKWDEATEMATAWLFGAPRIDPEGGDMVRGDIHMLFVSDPGMRKSVFAENLAELSPQCLLRDAGGMSSEVGLTSSASQDNFGDGKWTLTPGALPRANGGHLILDEVDKGPSNFLGGIHGALEGDQQLKVNKADIQATLATRVGFMALGNPVDGRFDPYEDIAEQIDLDPALMSRFDLIVTMEDTPDEQTDDTIAGGVLESIDESARMEYGDLEAEEAESVKPDVPREVMKAWVKIARDEIQPMMTDAAKGILRKFYVDTRQLNPEESNKPPVTARKLVAGWRLASAFARCELSETIEERHARRAVQLSKTVVGENFDPETGEFDADRTTEGTTSQQERVKRIKGFLGSEENAKTIEEIAEGTSLEKETVEHRIEKMQEGGTVVEPVQGEYRLV